jgi:hypothetical protein
MRYLKCEKRDMSQDEIELTIVDRGREGKELS